MRIELISEQITQKTAIQTNFPAHLTCKEKTCRTAFQDQSHNKTKTQHYTLHSSVKNRNTKKCK